MNKYLHVPGREVFYFLYLNLAFSLAFTMESQTLATVLP